jgi:metallophosphoesterase superfamily enzyme
VLSAEILERKQAEVIEREEIQKLILIADSDQDHPGLLDLQKTSVNSLKKTTSRMLEEQHP